ncbi:prolyl-tRNA editing protein [Oenococcus oeni]|uniref:Prolyl-tRNA editing protein n=1 Tax=Oenococcus oeni TaxID=1247 RepID=A0A6N3ZZF8_OENOE|nr:YbaK/EbsC family protein [Oenococcus oeni]OIM20570.1 prolyl-tRNA editing protein [Oenococcus oeni]
MTVERVRKYFEQFALNDRIKMFTRPTATVDQAAETLGVQADQIAKTLAFSFEDRAFVVVTSGMARISNQKFKKVFNQRPRMLPRDQVETMTGYRIGGVCPFALNDGVKVYLDYSLKKHDLLYPAAGDLNAAIRLSLDELEKYSLAAGWVDVAKEIAK